MGYGQYSAMGPWNAPKNTEASDKNPEGGRAKHVCDTSDIPHMWAHPLEKDGTGYYQTHARNPQSNLFYKTSEDGTRVIYSYRESYPIGSLFLVKKGKIVRRVYLTFGDKPYSVTTATHMNCTRGAVPRDAIHWDVLSIVSDDHTKPTKAEHLKNVQFLAKEYAETVAKLTKAKSAHHIGWQLKQATRQRKDAIEYAQFFGLRAPKLAPLPIITAERKARTEAFDAASTDRRARIRAARQARWEAQRKEYETARENERKTLPERIALWRQGVAVGYLKLEYALLRLITGGGAAHVQTSQSVTVPVSGRAGAARLFRFLKVLVDAQREYTRNGHTEHIGSFAVDSFKKENTETITEETNPEAQGIFSETVTQIQDYILTAGCHRIKWSEITALADAVLAAEAKEDQSEETSV